MTPKTAARTGARFVCSSMGQVSSLTSGTRAARPVAAGRVNVDGGERVDLGGDRLAERGQTVAAEGRAARGAEAQRVDEVAADLHAEVEAGGGRLAGHPDLAEHLLLAHRLSR